MDVQINDGVIWPPSTAKFEVSNGVSIPVAEFLMLSFSHHMEILSVAKTLEERIFYIHEAAQQHLDIRKLRDSIKRDDFHHRGTMPRNFAATIP